jgi:predicted PolB exonuclease-like 3'-5' exonuclease
MDRLKQLIVLACCLAVLFTGLGIYFFIDNINIKKGFEALSDAEEARYQQIKDSQYETIRADLEKKYHVDMGSFKSVVNQFEKEQQKVRELQEKLESRVITD